MKGKIYEFDPHIYKTRLWVCKKGVTLEEIDEVFDALCEDGTGTSFKDNHKLPSCDEGIKVYPVGHKKSCYTGLLVYLNRNFTPGDICHEAVHCTDWLFIEIGETERSWEHSEPPAYYAGWVFNCIWKVYKGKI